jgi:thymidylate synthase (FAD)
MTIELVWSTPNAEELITKMARVSNPSNENNMETAPGLLRYLIKHKHWSPFEMANLCIEIKTSRSIAAQILRHRSFSFQEYSQRYAPVTNLASVPELRRQDNKNRQNSIDDLDKYDVQGLRTEIGRHFLEAQKLYERLLKYGVAKECARDVLPLATSTRMYMNGTLRSWIHYIQLRCEKGTQLEHRKIAEAIRDLFWEQFPIIAEAAFGIETKPYHPTNIQFHF